MTKNSSSNRAVVPEAKGALDRFKFEVANELGVPLTDGYNGNLTSKQNGSVGGYMVKKMIEQQENMQIPDKLIPRCPHCGAPLSMNLRADSTFVEDKGWHVAANCYDDFLRRHKNSNVLFLELGTGYNTPGIIKYPFWQMTAAWPNAFYACINLSQADVPHEIRDKSIGISADIGEVLDILWNDK